MRVSITNFGCRIVSLEVPDRNGQNADVIPGFDSLAGYLAKNPCFGAVIGRYANRIAGGRYTHNGVELHQTQNQG